jgi:hypothetical protein
MAWAESVTRRSADMSERRALGRLCQSVSRHLAAALFRPATVVVPGFTWLPLPLSQREGVNGSVVRLVRRYLLEDKSSSLRARCMNKQQHVSPSTESLSAPELVEQMNFDKKFPNKQHGGRDPSLIADLNLLPSAIDVGLSRLIRPSGSSDTEGSARSI